MSANGGDLFKTTLMGGYDKEDVAEGIKKLKDEAYAEKTKLLGTIKERDKKISELMEKVSHKEMRIEELERDIREKYQSYIDNYDSIGRLVYDAQVRANTIIKDADEQGARIIEQAQEAAQKCLESVQSEVDERLSEGKKKYIAVQEELNETVELINQVQRRFMESCKVVHRIVSTMPVSIQDMEEDMDDEEGYDDQPSTPSTAPLNTSSRIRESLDEEDMIEDLEERLECQINQYLN